MEFVRYVIVFLTVGWGGGLLSALLFVITLPLLSGLRGTTPGRIAIAAENGLATLAAVILAFHACQWTGGSASYGMFAVALAAMVSNDLWRIRRAQHAHSIGGQALDEEPAMRAGMVATERMNLVGDLAGFVGGACLHAPTASSLGGLDEGVQQIAS